MPSLWYFSFYRCHRVECLIEGIQRLSALRFLGFNNCKSLISLPQGMKHLTALEYLDITNCEKLNLMEGDDYPTRLRTLCIWNLPQLVSLPQGLKGSTNTLQVLRFFFWWELGGIARVASRSQFSSQASYFTLPKIIVSARRDGSPHCPKRTED